MPYWLLGIRSFSTVRSCVFSKTVQQTQDASLDACYFVSKVTHNDLSHPNVHSNRGVGDGTIGYNIDGVKNSPQNPATDKAPGFKSDGPGFKSLMAMYESSECEIKHSGSGYVSRDMAISEPNGHGFESSQVTDLVVLLVGQESGEQDSGSAGRSDLTSSKSVGPGFESGVDKDMTTNSRSSVNAATDEVNQLCPIYDVNNVGMEEKFVNTIIFENQGNRDLAQGVENLIFYKLAYLWHHNCMLINGKIF